MKTNLLHIIKRSLVYHKNGVLYQSLIIILLSAVITGSLMTGTSVRSSLKKTSSGRLGNAGIMISSGIRYFDPSLAGRLSLKTELTCTGILEMEGYCRNFSTGQAASGVKIFATDGDFFNFQGVEGINLSYGEVAVNERVADYLGLSKGDELIVSFNAISDLPADAPFAPENKEAGSVVLKVAVILGADQSGNFSTGISQITPLNVFMNRFDLTDNNGRVPKINRLIIEDKNTISESDVYNTLTDLLIPEDIGLTLRFIQKTKSFEIISDRVFLDQFTIDEILNQLPYSFSVLTYLGNSFISGRGTTPYSFIAGLPSHLYPAIPGENGIIINSWLASDLQAERGDTITVSWYSPDPANRLVEFNGSFIVSQIVDMESEWSDSLLMPEFPGIAGKESCSNWDAGVSIKMDRIRQKDEEYWNKYKGSPKAFISYEKARELWGSNFGPATAIRFPEGTSETEIRSQLSGKIDPFKTGFYITDLRRESAKAASQSVDFSTLFLSLGFFIIMSAMILLVLIVSLYFESKERQIITFHSLGFSNKWIKRMLLSESGVTILCGTTVGVFTGWLLNLVLIKALNTVWRGAVQTDTLSSHFDPVPLIWGFIISNTIIFVILLVKTNLFLKDLTKSESGVLRMPLQTKNLAVAVPFFLLAVAALILSFFLNDHSTLLSFSGGIVMFISLVFLTRDYYIRKPENRIYSLRKREDFSRLYYSHNPSHAITPVIFIAAGLFAVIITGVNRMTVNNSMLKPSGGTGGFILWGESTVPVRDDLNEEQGRKEYGLDEDELRELSFVQARKKQGDDASCLNLNHISSPPLLGIDPSVFLRKGSFSFAGRMKGIKKSNPWSLLNNPPVDGTIYGIADQTVLQWGLRIKPGDSLIIRSETGQQLNIVMAAGLKASLFQGHVIIGAENFSRFFPSISGTQVFLVDGKPELSVLYEDILSERLSNYGVRFEPASMRLESFFVVTNTYLSVFSILGGIGMILGVTGLGFVLIRNFNQRKKEFGLMMATGFSLREIRRIIFGEQIIILVIGLFMGLIPALLATIHSVISGSQIPWLNILLTIGLVFAAGVAAIAVSLDTIKGEALIATIRRD